MHLIILGKNFMNFSSSSKYFHRYGLLLSWLILVLFDLLFRGTFWLQNNLFGIRFIENYVISSLALLSLLYLLSLIRKKWIMSLLFFLTITFPLIINGAYFLVYKKFISKATFTLVFESPRMVSSTSLDNINIVFLLFGILISAISLYFLLHFKVKRRWLFFPNSLYLLASFIFLLLHWISVDFFQTSGQAFYTNLFQYISSGKQSTYSGKRLTLSPIHKKIGPEQANFIFVIGESQVLDHMQIYGYSRETTPNLQDLHKQKKVIPFSKTISIGNKTRLSVPYMLSGLMGPEPNGIIYQIPNLFDYTKAAGYTNLFISSQDLRWGGLLKLFDSPSIDILLDGNTFSPSVDVHKGIDDLVLLPKALSILEKQQSPFLLVLQMDGSHYPYNIHSPDSLKKFLPEEDPNSINAYDNTLLVTDKYLSQLYHYISREHPNTYIFFCADHGQNFTAKGGHFNEVNSNQVINVPLLVFPPVGDSISFQQLSENKNKLCSQADIFASILDIAAIPLQYQIDGVSLLNKKNKRRLICSSEYMPTFHNNPNCTIIDTNMQSIFVFFSKNSVTDKRNNTYYPYSELDSFYKEILEKRLSRKKPIPNK